MLSILTSCRNRAAYLPRVWASLDAQTARDFEWIVGDDGSNDDVLGVVNELASSSAFPITLVRAVAHVGKSRIDNAMVEAAQGALCVFCDSDDWLADNAVEAILSAARPDLGGVTAFASANEQVIVDPFYPGETEVSWIELARRFGKRGSDMVYAARTDLLKAHPFPEVDLVTPESAVWLAIGDRPTAVVRKVLKRTEYGSPGAISHSGKMSYNRGRAHASATERAIVGGYPSSRTLLNFQRWALHGELGTSEARRLWGKGGALRYWLHWPLALILATRDVVQRKVVKSHRIFLANRDVQIQIRRFPLVSSPKSSKPTG